MKRVAVVGGGISGLTAAYYLQRANPSFQVRLFESAPKSGGIIATLRMADAVMECGPDAFLSEKPWALELCREIGLESEIISTSSDYRRSFVLNKGRLRPIPAGFYLTAPRTFSAWLSLPGLSFAGKLAMLKDLFAPARKGDNDESVADFVRRRFGSEALEKLAQPMIGGIYAAPPEKLSLLATFPKLREMEKKHGSVIRALAFARGTQSASGPRYSLFLSLRGGMASLTEKLQEILGASVRCLEPVQSVSKTGAGWQLKTNREVFEADAVCLAVPAYEAARLLSGNLAALLKSIRFEPAATINYLCERKSIRHPLDGFGFVVPASERRGFTGCTFSHRKFDGRVVNPNYVLLRAFVGGETGRELLAQTDDNMAKSVFLELGRILEIRSEAQRTWVSRYPQGMPQYEPGHLEKVKTIFDAAEKMPGLFLTGNSYCGVGIPDCVRHAKSASQLIHNYLKLTN